MAGIAQPNFDGSQIDQIHEAIYSNRAFNIGRMKDVMEEAGCDIVESLNLNNLFNIKNDSGIHIGCVLKTKRGTSHESFVIHAPFKFGDSPVEKMKRKLKNENDKPKKIRQNSVAVATILTLMLEFSEQNYWSKDILFLITDDVKRVPFNEYVSGIQAALTLELESMRVKNINLNIVGNNGQLPNLDLRNVVERLLYYRNLESTFNISYHGQRPLSDVEAVGGHWKGRLVRPDAPTPTDFWEFFYDFETGFDMVKKLAIGYSDGHHGDFLLERIEALTIRGTGKGGWIPANIFGYAIEGTSRSINNLLERFHQSFLYVS